MKLKELLRRMIQRFGFDFHKLDLDDSPFIDPRTASITSISINDRATRFLVADRGDVIQKHHAKGVFYEQDVLELVSLHFPEGGVFVDIGANVGNHCIYAAIHLKAEYVIAFEPMRRQHAILSINLLLNGLSDIVKVHKLALSDHDGLIRMITPHAQNIGRSMIADTVYGEWCSLACGDEILKGCKIDFVKIDVEGHEMQTLTGLEQTIARCRPTMLIEVDDINADDFSKWLEDNHYVSHRQLRHHSNNTEVLITPAETRPTAEMDK